MDGMGSSESPNSNPVLTRVMKKLFPPGLCGCITQGFNPRQMDRQKVFEAKIIISNLDAKIISVFLNA